MNILFTINNKYVDQIIILIDSILKHNKGVHSFYFIYASINESNRLRISNFCLKKKCKSTFKLIDISVLKDLPINGRNWSTEIYFRLLACYVLDSIDKILYLDADIICTNSLDNLYNNDNITIGACLNDDQNATTRLNIENYYNSGVLLLNLEKLRSIYSMDDILKQLNIYKDKLLFPDQDFINIVYKDYISPIDNRYNYMISVSEINKKYPKRKDVCLIHYVMEKPWDIKFPYKTDIIYLKAIIKREQIIKAFILYILHRMYRTYQLLFVKSNNRRIQW